MKLSNKDLLIILGIVVAVVITLTTVVYQDHQSAAKKSSLPASNGASIHRVTTKIIGTVVGRVEELK